MTKVEQYIKDYTKSCSNEIIHRYPEGNPYAPWLTPDHARAVAQIAREETIEDVISWISDNIYIGPHFDLVVNKMRKDLLNEESLEN